MGSANLPGTAATAASTQPDPALFWFTALAFQRTAALRAAAELGVFTAIGEGRDNSEALADRTGASERGVRILCDYLTVIGFLTKENGRYRLTPTSAVLLDERSPSYLGTALRFMNSREMIGGFENLTETVRRGTTLLPGAGIVDSEDPVWVEYARSMAPLAAPDAEFIAQLVAENSGGPLRVLDIAAGHGLFGIAIARRNALAEIVAVDWPNVLQVALENARAAGVDGRYRLLPGDAWAVEFGTGFDLVLVTHLLHSFAPPACEALMKKIHACLKPGGRAINLEFIPNDDRITPPIPASFSLMMLGLTPAGDAYTFQQFDRMFHAAGFERNEITQIPQSAGQVIVSYR
jgi:ubiquinone/menaquinone biosynthesis C-methylase UbiE